MAARVLNCSFLHHAGDCSDSFKTRRITPAWKGSQAGKELELAGYEQFGDGDDELGGSRGTIHVNLEY